jgi:septal ring factor EnvC (AmiA/AmiB activator)
VNAPIGQPPLDALPPDAPATVEDVRASRRWTWVALAWAIAASAIAVIALVTGNNSGSNNTQTPRDLTPRIDKLEQDTNARLDAFSRRLNDKASSADLQKVDKRLTTVEDDLAQAKRDLTKQSDVVTQLQTDVKDLRQRVSDLESKQQSPGTTTTP